MDVAATTAFARKRLAQVPGLNKKVEDARKTLERSKPHGKDGQIAEAEARVARLQDIVPANFKLIAYSDKGGLLSSASKFVSKRLTVEAVKAVLKEQGEHTIAIGSETEGEAADASAGPALALTSSSNDIGAVSAAHQIANKAVIAAVQQKQVQVGNASSARAVGVATPAKDAVPHTEAVPSRAEPGMSSIEVPGTNEPANGCRTRASRDGGSCRTIGSCSLPRGRSKAQWQKLQQLAMADELFDKIDDYVAHEVASMQQQQQNGPADALQAGANCNLEVPSAAAAHSITPDALRGITADGWTPELMASLALRFQEFGLPHGANTMPDLATMIKEAQQQELEAACQKQQQEQQQRLLQQQKQQLTNKAAIRHLQLYQLGVQQQLARRDRCNRAAGRLVGVSMSPGASVPLHAKGAQKSSQQHSMQQQQAGTEEALHQEDRQPLPKQLQSPAPSAVTAAGGVDGAAVGAAADQESATASESSGRPTVKFCDASTGGGAAGTSSASALPALPHTAVPQDPAAAPAEGPRAQAASSQAADGCRHSSHHTHSAAASAVTQQPKSAKAPDKIQRAAAPDAAVITHVTAGVQQRNSPVVPAVSRYQCDAPGVPAGSSHGYLSPAGLKFDHLPGSRRQVYAQIQDALACSNVITAAEQGLRALRYAPSGAAGPTSS